MLFPFLSVISSNFLTIPVAREKFKVKLALAIPAGAPITHENGIMILHHLLHLIQLKFYQNNQKL